MARRRMFSLDVVDTDNFLDLPASTQALYFHLGMRADDEGFISSPRKIAKLVNCGSDDLKLLVVKGYLIPFESGVCIITDWKRNNLIPKDRFHASGYIVERGKLEVVNSRYYQVDTECIQDVYKMYPETRQDQPSLDKVSLDKPSLDKPKDEDAGGQAGCLVVPCLDDVLSFASECGAGEEMAHTFFDTNAARNWSIKGEPIRDWRKLFRSWLEHERRQPAKAGLYTAQDYADSKKYCLC